MFDDRFNRKDVLNWILGHWVQTRSGNHQWLRRKPLSQALSLQETISRASVYAVGIVVLSGLTYLCLSVSNVLSR